MSNALRVYVAGPYTAAPEACTNTAIDAGNALLDLGFAPFVPHLAHFWDTQHTHRPYEDWMRLDLAWVRAADALLRLPGTSLGADREVQCAMGAGVPVFYTIGELVEWAFPNGEPATYEVTRNIA